MVTIRQSTTIPSFALSALLATALVSPALHSSQLKCCSKSQSSAAASTAAADSSKDTTKAPPSVTIALWSSPTGQRTFTLRQDDFETLQKIFKFELTDKNLYIIKNFFEFNAALIAIRHLPAWEKEIPLSKDKETALKELDTSIDASLKKTTTSKLQEAVFARIIWYCFREWTVQYGNQSNSPDLKQYPHLEPIYKLLARWYQHQAL